MKDVTRSVSAKIAAVMILFVMIVVCLGSILVIIMAGDKGFYTKTQGELEEEVYREYLYQDANRVFADYGEKLLKYGPKKADQEIGECLESENVVYEIRNIKDNSVIYKSGSEKTKYEITYDISCYDEDELLGVAIVKFGGNIDHYEEYLEYGVDEEYDGINYEQLEKKARHAIAPAIKILKKCEVKIGVKEEITGMDKYTSVRKSEFIYKLRYAVIATALVSFVIGIILFCFLMVSAGRKKDEKELQVGFLGTIPLEISSLGMVLLMFSMTIWTYANMGREALLVWLILGCIEYVIGINFCMNFAILCKKGKWWRNTICYKCFSGSGYLMRHLSIVWKTMFVFAGICFAEFLFKIQAVYAYEEIGMWFLERLVIGLILWWYVIGLKRLKQAGDQMAKGQLEETIDTRHMSAEMKEHAKNLNKIREGMNLAVEQKMRSEHMKTELITNVSHDIKTPLTSIINYADLLSKLELEDEQAKEYIEVLGRQSTRLKKLIEDLIEASKATTGNLKAELVKNDVSVILTQTVGEFEERLQKNGLELILKQPEGEYNILADPRHLSRVFDNLMNNISKYAQPDTRVYLDVERKNGMVSIIFKNISKYELNISSEELMERFVRGDRSRHTEGSGLGLSIARSLTELMGGRFELEIDGDLFKVKLIYREIV